MKTKMVVYAQEKADGLADMLQDPALSKLVFESLAENIVKDELQYFDLFRHKESIARFAKADISDEDLYPLKTVLVTTAWNKNDDVFTPVETWAARHTPEDKPFNLRHIENDIIGHITDDKCFDSDFKIIADHTPVDELPNKFHIVTAAVIYRHWREKSLKDRMEQIIAEIAEKKWFVSMECWFQGFDYGIKTEAGESYIVARTAETAFLSKHLRAYGGTGEYDNHKIGRILKNITFTGKGLVENPANPESVVLAEFNPIPQVINTTIAQLITPKKDKEKYVMAENDKINELQSEITSLKASIKTLETERDSLNKKLNEVDTKAAQAEVNSLKETIKANETKVTELETQVAELVKSNETLVKEKEDVEKAAKATAEELAKIKLESAKAARIAKLVAVGFTQEEAVAKVEKFISASDEMFDEIVAIAGSSCKNGDKKKKMMDDDEDDAEADASEEELDETEAEESEASLNTDGEETEEQNTVLSAISSYLESNVLSKTKNK